MSRTRSLIAQHRRAWLAAVACLGAAAAAWADVIPEDPLTSKLSDAIRQAMESPAVLAALGGVSLVGLVLLARRRARRKAQDDSDAL